jgi:hypothetical protein
MNTHMKEHMKRLPRGIPKGALRALTAAFIILWAVALTHDVRADEPSVQATPDLSASASVLDERVGVIGRVTMQRFSRGLELEQGGRTQGSLDGLWRTGLFGGVRIAWTDLSASYGHLRSDFEFGVEYLPHTGGVPLTIQGTTSWVCRFQHDLWLSLGARLGLSVDAPDADYSNGEVSVPLGLGWRWLELQYAFGFTYPLYRREDVVFGGVLRRGAASDVMVMDFAVVVRF